MFKRIFINLSQKQKSYIENCEPFFFDTLYCRCFRGKGNQSRQKKVVVDLYTNSITLLMQQSTLKFIIIYRAHMGGEPAYAPPPLTNFTVKFMTAQKIRYSDSDFRLIISDYSDFNSDILKEYVKKKNIDLKY